MLSKALKIATALVFFLALSACSNSQSAVRQSGTTPSAKPREISGIITKVDTTNKTIKLVLWDHGLTKGPSGKYVALSVRWSSKSVFQGEKGSKPLDSIAGADDDVKTPEDLTGWKAAMEVTGNDSAPVLTSMYLAAALAGESIPAMVSNSGAVPIGGFSGKVPPSRVKELDEESEIKK